MITLDRTNPPIADLMETARAVSMTPMSDGRDVPTLFAIMLAGWELGLGSMASLRQIYLMQGKIVLSAGLILGLAKQHPDCEYIRQLESTNERCVMEAKRRSSPTPERYTFDLNDARMAGLNSATWKKHAKAMLRARCAGHLARGSFPDAVAGIYDPEELGPLATTEPPLEHEIPERQFKDILEAIEALPAPLWMREGIARRVRECPVSWLPGLGEELGKRVREAGFKGPETYIMLRRALEQNTLQAIPGIGKGRETDVARGLKEYFDGLPVDASIGENAEPEAPSVDELPEGLPDVEKQIDADPKRPEYWVRFLRESRSFAPPVEQLVRHLQQLLDAKEMDVRKTCIWVIERLKGSEKYEHMAIIAAQMYSSKAGEASKEAA